MPHLLLLLLRLLLLHCVPPATLITAPTAPLVSVLAHLGIPAQVHILAAMDIALHLTPVHRAIIMSSQPAVQATSRRVIKLAITIVIRDLQRQ